MSPARVKLAALRLVGHCAPGCRGYFRSDGNRTAKWERCDECAAGMPVALQLTDREVRALVGARPR